MFLSSSACGYSDLWVKWCLVKGWIYPSAKTDLSHGETFSPSHQVWVQERCHRENTGSSKCSHVVDEHLQRFNESVGNHAQADTQLRVAGGLWNGHKFQTDDAKLSVIFLFRKELRGSAGPRISTMKRTGMDTLLWLRPGIWATVRTQSSRTWGWHTPTDVPTASRYPQTSFIPPMCIESIK